MDSIQSLLQNALLQIHENENESMRTADDITRNDLRKSMNREDQDYSDPDKNKLTMKHNDIISNLLRDPSWIVANQDITFKCEAKARETILSVRTRMTHTIDEIHKKENEKKNHIRFHYDDKLSTCRLSYLAQNNHLSKKMNAERLESERYIKESYQSQTESLSEMVVHLQEVVRIQEATMIECREGKYLKEKELKEIQHEFDTFKSHMNEKYLNCEQTLERITKQEVFAHFKIIYLKKKLAIAERTLQVAKEQYKGLMSKSKELRQRLRVSLKIRTGMKQSFEKRAALRGRLDILHTEKAQRRGRNASCGICRQFHEKQCQTDIRRIELKNQAIDTAAFDRDEIVQLKQRIDDIETKAATDLAKYETSTKQNKAYKRLISSKNIANILASEHKSLCAKPNSLDAQLLYDLTSPLGVLVKEKLGHNLIQLQRSKPCDHKRHNSSTSIPTQNKIINFSGIQGNEYNER